MAKKTIILMIVCLLMAAFFVNAAEISTLSDKVLDAAALTKIYGTDDVSLIKEQIFPILKSNDALKKEAIFTMDNTLASADKTSTSSLSFKFNEVCGRIKSYTITIPQTCTITECNDVKTYSDNKTFTIKNVCELKNYECDKEITDISGIKDYKIKADIEDGNCWIGGTLYKYSIDWMPELIINENIIITQEKYSWWNSTGGNITTIMINGTNYTMQIFTDNGTFKLYGSRGWINAQILLIAGGGGSGRGDGSAGGSGGGGAGGYIYNSSYNITSNITVIVGRGGIGQTTNTSRGNNGTYTSFGVLNATGGGGGAVGVPTGSLQIGINGGSGGGAGGKSGGSIGGTGVSDQGFGGGNFTGTGYSSGGGGGGCGAYGMNGIGGSRGGDGGGGCNSSITGVSVCRAGGGGGFPNDVGGSMSGNATCGGGNASKWYMESNGTGGYGINGTGGGAGASGYSFVNGVSGGNGIVILLYETYTGCSADADCSLCQRCENSTATCVNETIYTDLKNECQNVSGCDSAWMYRNGFCDGAGACGNLGYHVSAGHICINSTAKDVNATAANNCGIWSDCIIGNKTAAEFYVGYAAAGAVCNDTDWQSTGSFWNATSFYHIAATVHNDTCQETLDCQTDWSANYGSCEINDTALITYQDLNNCNSSYELPSDNGTYGYECNYCSEELVPDATPCVNGVQTLVWYDNNYASCCLVTGLASDCEILYYPYLTPERTNCTLPNADACNSENLTKDFNCSYDPNPLLKDKMNVVCVVPDNQSYQCVINVFQSNNLLASTPEYKEASGSILNINGQGDTRSFFTPNSRMLNAFYTDKNIVSDTTFKMQVLCTSYSSEIKSEYCVIPQYEPPNWINGRFVWIKNNAPLMIVAAILFITLTAIGVYYLRKLK